MTDNKFLLVLVFAGLPVAILLMPLIVLAVAVVGISVVVSEGFRRLQDLFGSSS